MDYEKAYKELVGKIKNAHLYALTDSTKNVLEEIFPELAESEDEKIRKWLINDIKQAINGDIYNDENIIDAKKALAFLEKQGEPIDKIVKRAMNEKQRVLLTETNGDANIDWDTRSLQDVKLLLEYGLDYIKKLEKQGEQKPTQSPKAMTKLEEKLSSLVVAAVHTYCEKNLLDTPHFVGLNLGDKMAKEWSKEILTLAEEELRKMREKPVEENKGNIGGISPNWSEEDGMILSLIVNNLKFIRDTLSHDDKYTVDVGSFEGQIEWLKSLQDRVQPQPKHEWSEEDKRKIDRIYSILRQAADTHAFSTTCRLIGDKECIELQDFLKSLRPQNHWKPSDEQIRALKHAFNDGSITFAEMEILATLYEGLKFII